MHSSRMRIGCTGRLRGAGGLSVHSGVSAQGGVHLLSVNRTTDMCKNITFPQLRLWTVKIEVGAENILVLAALTSIRCIYAKQSVSALSLSSLGYTSDYSFNKKAFQWNGIRPLSRWFSGKGSPPPPGE